MIRTILIALTLAFTATSFTGKKGEPFEGYAKLDDCKEEIPLYYATKKKGPLLEAAKRLQDVEIVLVTTERKALPTYKYYYLIISDAIDGQTAVLVDSKDYKSDSAQKSVLFLGYKKRKHFFYRADCFNEKLNGDSELAKKLKKGED